MKKRQGYTLVLASLCFPLSLLQPFIIFRGLSEMLKMHLTASKHRALLQEAR